MGRTWFATDHFRERVHERVGADVDADGLMDFLGAEIDGCRLDYIGRIRRDGLRLFRAPLSQGVFYPLVDTGARTGVTIMPGGRRVQIMSRGRRCHLLLTGE